MRLRPSPLRSRRAAFTIIEMVGVISIIATLIAVLVPQVINSVSRSRVMDAVGCYNSIRAGAITYASKYGFLGNAQGQSLVVSASPDIAGHWDREVLLQLKLIDEVFRTRISTDVAVEVRESVPPATVPDGSNPAFNLLGASPARNDTGGAKHVLAVHLSGVMIEHARELNRYLDGDSSQLGESSAGVDLRGRVKYDLSATSIGDVYLYVVHL